MPDSSAYQVQTIDRLIAISNYGDDAAEATRLHDMILARIAELACESDGQHKGKLVLTIDYVGDRHGVDISVTSKATVPPAPKRKERFFLTVDNRLTMQDPARDSLFPGSDLGRVRRDLSA